MPEVVYPTPDAEGNSRTWDQVFPIWQNDDEATEWRVINEILEAIAMNNRFGDKKPEELKQFLLTEQHNWFHEELAKRVGEPHDHEKEGVEGHTAFGCTVDEKIPEERMAVVEERKKYFISYGKRIFYINEVFANLGGAYREWK